MECDLVFGYGAIINTKDFVKLYPSSFIYNNKRGEWESIGDYQDICIYHSVNKNTDKIFISTFDSIEIGYVKPDKYNMTYQEKERLNDALKTHFPEAHSVMGYGKKNINDPYHAININQINKQKESLDEWMKKYFPEAEIGYFIYRIF